MTDANKQYAAPVATAEAGNSESLKALKSLPRAERRRAKKNPKGAPATQPEQPPQGSFDPARTRIKLEELVETFTQALVIVSSAGKQMQDRQAVAQLKMMFDHQKALAEAGAELDAGVRRLLTEKRKTIPAQHADTLDGLCAAFAKAKAKAQPKQESR